LKNKILQSPPFQWSFLAPQYWGTWSLAAVIALSTLLPRPWILMLGRRIGRLFYRINQKRVAIARVNLEWCFPEFTADERETLLRLHLVRYGQAIVDMGLVWWASRSRIDRLCTVSGGEELQRLRASGEKVLLVIPHVLGIDMTGAALSALAPGASMMKTPSNPLLHRWLWRGRSRFGAKIYTRNQGLRPLVKAIRAGHVGYLMPDEDLDGAHSVFAPFFGIPTATLPVVGRIARMTGAKVMPVFCELDNRGRYHVTIGHPLSGFPSGDIEADAAAVNAAFETGIRTAPEQYLWTLKWFRTRPDGEASPYAG